MSRLIDADELKSKFLEMGCMDGKPCYGAEIIDRMPTVKAVPIEDILGHAKAIKEYCQQRDNIDDCCERCPFHDYLGTKGICVLNYGLYPNEWYEPYNERSDDNE